MYMFSFRRSQLCEQVLRQSLASLQRGVLCCVLDNFVLQNLLQGGQFTLWQVLLIGLQQLL